MTNQVATVRSALPGRVRWDVPVLTAQPDLASSVQRRLRATPSVHEVIANPLTGRVLLQFDAAVPVDTASTWLADAIARAINGEPEPIVPTVFEVVNGAESSPFARLMHRADRHRTLAGLTIGASFFNRLFEATPPLMIGTAVDVVTRGPQSILGSLGFKSVASQLTALGGFSIVLWSLDAAMGYTQRVLSAELANRVRHDLRNEVYQHLQKLDRAQIDERGTAGWLMVLDDDIKQVHRFIEEGADPIVTIAANGLIVASAFLLASPAMAAFQLLLLPPLVMASRGLLPPIKKRFGAARRDAENLQDVLYGNVAGQATIAAFNQQDREAAHVENASEALVLSERNAYRLSAAYVPTLQMIVGGGFITTLVWGGSLVSRGQLSAGAFNVMGFSELRLMVALGRLGVSLENYQRTRVSLDRILEVLDTQPTIVDGDRALPAEQVVGDVVFDRVSFKYEADRNVLSNLSLHLPAGKTTGIVGATGAGKSTVLKLLLRFYDVTGGAIRLDGHDIRELRQHDLREAIALVPQDIVLFAGTVHENIAYGNPGASREEVERAARIAEADGFVSALPEGYDTRISHGGSRLSGGQRQRLAIARAALANRPVLLFDEATSSLDNETEAALQRSLRQVTEGRTTVIVAHRLSTIRYADVIYVLDEGEVRERGSHDELVAADGIYASMWRVQTGARAD